MLKTTSCIRNLVPLKKNRNGVGTDLGQAGGAGTLFDKFVAFFMDDFIPE